MLNVKQGSCEYQLLKSSSLTRPGPWSTDCEANTLTTRPRAGWRRVLQKIGKVLHHHNITIKGEMPWNELSAETRKQKSYICKFLEAVLVFTEFERVCLVCGRSRSQWPTKSYIALQMVRHRFNIYANICVALTLRLGANSLHASA